MEFISGVVNSWKFSSFLNKKNRISEFNDLKCGITDDHIVREPISLSCGHCICKNCVPDIQEANINCKICSVETVAYLDYLMI